jgi:tetratricopeptide (TPR) repeat protein
MALANVYREQGKMDEAVQELELVISRDEESWQAMVQLARLFNSIGKASKAIPLLSKASQLNPDNSQIKFRLGRTFFEMGRYQEAMDEFNCVTEIEPENLLAKIEIARVYFVQGNSSEARKILVKLTHKGRNLFAVHKLLGEIFVHGKKFTEAVGEFRAAALGHPKLAEKNPAFIAALETKESDEVIARKCMEAISRSNLENLNQVESADFFTEK